MPLQFCYSEKRRKKLLLDGHLFLKDRQRNESLKTYWKCDMCRKTDCRARAITVGDAVEAVNGFHNHAADAVRIEALKLKDYIRNQAINTQEPANYILSNASAAISIEAAGRMARVDTMKRMIRNIRMRQREEVALSNMPRPPTVIIHEQYRTIKEEEPFFAYDEEQAPTEAQTQEDQSYPCELPNQGLLQRVSFDYEEQAVKQEEENPEIPTPSFTLQGLEEAFTHIEKAIEIFTAQDPNYERSRMVTADLRNACASYSRIYEDNKQNCRLH